MDASTEQPWVQCSQCGNGFATVPEAADDDGRDCACSHCGTGTMRYTGPEPAAEWQAEAEPTCMTPAKATAILAALPSLEAKHREARRCLAVLREQAEIALAVGVPLDRVKTRVADPRDYPRLRRKLATIRHTRRARPEHSPDAPVPDLPWWHNTIPLSAGSDARFPNLTFLLYTRATLDDGTVIVFDEPIRRAPPKPPESP